MKIEPLIRPATITDIAIMRGLEREAAGAAHWSAERYQSIFTEPGANRLALILEQDSAVQGFLVAHGVGPEWDLENIVIAGPAQRRGLGTALLRTFLQQAQGLGATVVFLEVRESNLAARRLYQKLGFAESGRRSRYYRDPVEDALTYRLSLGRLAEGSASRR